MSRKRDQQLIALSRRLEALGINMADQNALRLIELTLSRWSEQECGDEYGNAIGRDEATGAPYRTFERGDGSRGRYRIPDRERGALRRLAAIMGKYPALWYYHQGDPRGCALYVGRWADMPSGDKVLPVAEEREQLDQYYTRGVAVCL